MRGRGALRLSSLTFAHRGPSIPFPARLFANSLPVVVARPAVRLAYSKSRRKRMHKDCPQQVSSMSFFCISSSLCLMCHCRRRLSRLEGQYLVQPANCLQSLLNPYHLVITGHAKPDDWHAIFSRQNSLSSPNSKR